MEEIFIKQTNTTVRVDEDNKVLLAFDVVNGIVDEQSEGILAEVSPFMYDEIKNLPIEGTGVGRYDVEGYNKYIDLMSGELSDMASAISKIDELRSLMPSVNDLKNELDGVVDGYTKYHLYKMGYHEFHNTPHNLKGVIKWFNQYDKEHGERKSMKWSWMDYK